MDILDSKLLLAYFRKPKKVIKYYDIFSNIIDGKKWNWSWICFLFGPLILIYRKRYFIGFVSLLLYFIPYINILFAVIIGGYCNVLIFQQYKKYYKDSLSLEPDEDAQIAYMFLSGKNDFVSIIANLIALFFIFVFILIVIGGGDKDVKSNKEIVKKDTYYQKALEEIDLNHEEKGLELLEKSCKNGNNKSCKIIKFYKGM